MIIITVQVIIPGYAAGSYGCGGSDGSDGCGGSSGRDLLTRERRCNRGRTSRRSQLLINVNNQWIESIKLINHKLNWTNQFKQSIQMQRITSQPATAINNSITVTSITFKSKKKNLKTNAKQLGLNLLNWQLTLWSIERNMGDQ